MKIIKTNKISAVTGTNENVNYPDDNMIDEHPKKVFYSTTQASTIKFTVGADSNGFSIFNTNAKTLEITIKDSAETSTLVATQSFDLSGIDSYYKLMHDSGVAFSSMWYDYALQDVEHKIIVSADTTVVTTLLYVGLGWAGSVLNFNTPRYGLTENLIDTSIIEELNNGSLYYRKRDIAREFSGTIEVIRDPDFYAFMTDIAIAKGVQPMAWNLTDISGWRWVIFGSMLSMPTGEHSSKNFSTINFSVREIL